MDVATLKGKSTRKRPPIVRSDQIQIPREILMEHRKLELCMDIMYIAENPLFTSIDKAIKYRGVGILPSLHAEQIYEVLDIALRRYNSAGFLIDVIHADKQFQPLLEEVSDELDIKLNIAPAKEHVPDIERNNRTLEERI